MDYKRVIRSSGELDHDEIQKIGARLLEAFPNSGETHTWQLLEMFENEFKIIIDRKPEGINRVVQAIRDRYLQIKVS